MKKTLLVFLLLAVASIGQGFVQSSSSTGEIKTPKKRWKSYFGVGANTFDFAKITNFYNNNDLPKATTHRWTLNAGLEKNLNNYQFGILSVAGYSDKNENLLYRVRTTAGSLVGYVGHNFSGPEKQWNFIPKLGLGLMSAISSVNFVGGNSYSRLSNTPLAGGTIATYSLCIQPMFEVLYVTKQDHKYRLNLGYSIGLPSSKVYSDGYRLSGAPKLSLQGFYATLGFNL